MDAVERQLQEQQFDVKQQLEAQQKEIAELKEEVQNQHRLIDHPYP